MLYPLSYGALSLQIKDEQFAPFGEVALRSLALTSRTHAGPRWPRKTKSSHARCADACTAFPGPTSTIS